MATQAQQIANLTTMVESLAQVVLASQGTTIAPAATTTADTKVADPYGATVKSVSVTLRDGTVLKSWKDMSKVLAAMGGRTELTEPAHGLITGGQLTALRNRLRAQ